MRAYASGESPQERLELNGPAALSDAELLANILRTGRPKMNIVQVCQQLLNQAGGLPGLLRYDRTDFSRQYGIGPVKSLQLLAFMELARRLIIQSPKVKPLMDSPEKVYNLLQPQMQNLEVEQFRVLCLNRKNRLIQDLAVTSGTATASLVHPREVFRGAIRYGATAIIAVHNHPSGDPAPSAADIAITRQLQKAAKVIQIELLDHIIVGNNAHDPAGKGYYSFGEGGLLDG
jgi:DNA repair protein RadC